MLAKSSVLWLGMSLASALFGYYLSQSRISRTAPSPSGDLHTESSSRTNRPQILNPPDVKKLVVVTRIHQQEASKMADIQKVVFFVQASLKYASKVFVCTGQVSANNHTYWTNLKDELDQLGRYFCSFYFFFGVVINR